MSALHVTVLEAFKSMGWDYRLVPDMEVVECAFEAHHTRVVLHAQSHAEQGVVTVVATSSVTLPPSHLKAGAELVMRVNKELNLGNFEIEWDTGLVMFRVANVFGKSRADSRIVASLAHTSVAEMDRLTPYLLELAHANELELPVFSIPGLLAREDLLPDIPEQAA
jgi:hypothetical protein